jgi:antitoxin component YwqK of YwqJK toxin-antitoxin module
MKKVLIILILLTSCSSHKVNIEPEILKTLEMQEEALYQEREANMDRRFFSKIGKTVVHRDTLALDSLVINYFTNGQIASKVPYKNGKINGIFEDYYYNGQLNGRERRINSVKVDGYYYSYDDFGDISWEGRIKNGLPVGVHIHYLDGKPCDKYIYNRKGKVVKIKRWNSEKGKWERCKSCMGLINDVLMINKGDTLMKPS